MSKMRVGIVGLGIMGTAYARNLIAAGFEVSGFDISADRGRALEDCGGFSLSNARMVAERSDIVLIALASVEALDACTIGKDGLGDAALTDIIICEMGTFSLEQKIRLCDQLEQKGAKVLDCPVSGTGAQAALGDLSIYVSGEEKVAQKAQPVFEALARDVRYVGTYGTGIKLKFIANLLVTIHNLATAEALMLAKQSDLDLQMVYDAITHGAGTSRMFEVRGQMMIDENYQPATMKHDIYAKDLQLIIDYARQSNSPTPLMAASLPFYSAALAQGRGKEDTASLYGVLKGLTEKKN
jgi:putative dehydrogenase